MIITRKYDRTGKNSRVGTGTGQGYKENVSAETVSRLKNTLLGWKLWAGKSLKDLTSALIDAGIVTDEPIARIFLDRHLSRPLQYDGARCLVIEPDNYMHSPDYRVSKKKIRK